MVEFLYIMWATIETSEPEEVGTGCNQRRLEPVVILRNGHMTIAHCAISVMQLPCTHCPRNAISNVYTLL